jgi:hypothetical protein
MIWRVEVFDSYPVAQIQGDRLQSQTNNFSFKKMALATVAKESYGTFFKGDTYLVYYASESKTDQHIHLWIGNESTKV